MKKTLAWLLTLFMVLTISSVTVFAAETEVAKIGDVGYATLQAAIDAAVDGDTITLVANVTENVVITQKADLDLTVDGANKTFTGVMTVFGDGRQSGAETLTIKNVVFQAAAGKTSCIVSPDRSVYNKYSYSHNVTVENCTFYGSTETPLSAAAIRHEDGGDKNLTVKNCTVDANMHSLLQVNNVAGKLVVDGCTVNSKNGLNLNSCTNVEITNCDINVKGYAVRAGVNSGGNVNEEKTFVLENNTLTTDNSEGDAVIVLRKDAAKATISMEKNSVEGNTHISGVTATNTVEADGNYWGGAAAPVVSGTAVKVDSFYTDSDCTNLATAKGNDFTGYTSADAIWGEVWGNATKSFVIKVLDANDNVMGTTSLNNIGGIIDGDVNVTWSIKLDAASNTDECWTMEWTTAPSVNNMPAKVELWVDGFKVSGGEVVLNAPDNLSEIYAAKVDDDGKILGYYTSLGDAVAAGGNVAILRAGTYSVPTGKSITITGAVDGVVFDNIGACNMGGANVTFNNVTFDYLPNINYTGLQHSGNLVYNNCTINGQVFLYGTSETFNNCTFNQTSAAAYNVWTYGAKDVAFNGCTFNSAGKSVLIYSEQSDLVNNVTVTKSTFNASSAVDDKAAIEIDTSLTAGANISVDAATTATGFDAGSVSGNSLWNNKMGNDTEANNDVTVTVAGETVLKPVVLSLSGTGTAEDPFLINNLEELIWFRDSVNTYQNDGSNQYRGKYFKLTTDIDLAGINWEPIGKNTQGDHQNFLGTFDGGGHTISNLYINADGDHLGFFARVGSYAEGVTPTVKNITFNNVDVSSNTTTGHGGSYVGGVIANAGGNSVVSGVKVTGNVYVAGYGYVGGIVGHGYPDIDNCSVVANDGSYIHGHYWCCGGIIGYAGEGGTPITNSSVSGLDIWSAYGCAGAVAGLLQDGNKLENVSASNVEITSNSDYFMGYIAGNGNSSTMTDVTMTNVTATVNGAAISATDAVATIGNKIYSNLEAAFADASDGDTVILLNNISDSVDYNVDKTLTLDLNGYEIKSNADVVLTASAGELTIVDNSADKTGAIVSGGKTAIYSSAYVAIKSGKFDGAITTKNAQIDDSQVCITGGNFSVEPNASIIKHTYIAVLAEDETYNVIPDEYEVIINANGGVVTGAGFYKFGETVYIYADKNGNYIFAGWLSDDVEIMNPGERLASFVMPDHEVVVTAYWASNGTTTPVIPVIRGTIHFETNGGSAINSYTGTYGAKVDLAQFVTIRQGYTFAGWYSDAALSKPVTQLTLGGTKTVYAGWIETPVIPDVPVVVLPFTDVAADAYYYNAVLWAVGMGITNGISDTAFGPDMVCTRAQVVTFLWRAAGCPVAQNDDMPFADVTRDMYYYDAVLWAVEQGITNGISDTEFGPDAECSRAQIVTFLWRSQGSPAVEADGEFHDVDADAYYATAVEWAVDNGVTNGVGDDAFAPDAECTRAQTVTFLYRHFCK